MFLFEYTTMGHGGDGAVVSHRYTYVGNTSLFGTALCPEKSQNIFWFLLDTF